jgi:glutaredoxin
VREFLSARNIPFTERNIRRDPEAKAELLALTGNLVVPVVVARDRHVVGFAPEWLESVAAAAGRPAVVSPPRDSASPEQGNMAARAQADLAATVGDLLTRVREELVYNAAKGDGAYRQGMHDGLRFAEDALVGILQPYRDESDLAAGPDELRRMDA